MASLSPTDLRVHQRAAAGFALLSCNFVHAIAFFLESVGRDRRHKQQILSIQYSQHTILSQDYYCKEHVINTSTC